MRIASLQKGAQAPQTGNTVSAELPGVDMPAVDAPDWGARRWLAAFGVAVCAISLTLTGHLRQAAWAEADAEASRLAEKTAVAAEFVQWHSETRLAAAVMGEETPAPADQYVPVPELVLASADVSDLVAYDFTELEIASIKADERRCMADAIYYESRNETMMGKLGVADVVLNRVKSPLWPDTICGVVYQGSERRTGCQFSFTCDGSMKRRRNDGLYAEIDRLAGVVIAGMHMPVSRNATHYHADYVDPYWAPSLTPTATIGAHKFYRFPGKSTQTVVSAAQ